MKKMEKVLKVVELLAAVGVTTLVGGALVMVTPNKLGIVKKIAVSVAGTVIAYMATDAVTSYMDRQFKEIITQFQDVFKKKTPKEETINVEEAEAQA